MHRAVLLVLLIVVIDSVCAAETNPYAATCTISINDDLKAVKLFFYKIDSDLPQLGESKRKYLAIKSAEFRNILSSEQSRFSAFKELFADPEYQVFEVKNSVVDAIGKLEKLPDAMAARDLGFKFKNSITTSSVKDIFPIYPTDKLPHILDAIDAMLAAEQALSQIEKSAKNLELLGKSELFGTLNLQTGTWQFQRGTISGRIRSIHYCYVGFLLG